MRCPKCQYISFDSADRCRNCGYEFALTADAPPLDLPIQTGNEAIGPLDDLPIHDGPIRPSPAPPHRARASRARALHASEAEPSPTPPPMASVFDLPLFKDRHPADDAPLVGPSAVPRQPLSVRRSNPVVVPRAPRALSGDPVLDLDADDREGPPPERAAWLSRGESTARASAKPAAHDNGDVTAGVAPRLLAGILDGAILVSICTLVLYITLQLCGLRFDQLAMLPALPLAGFLLLLVGGYFVLLTAAGGQTIGKMAAGVRVVPMDSTGRVSLGSSAMRAAGYLVSLVPAGLGLVPALFQADRRALHDRLADTRVVKA